MALVVLPRLKVVAGPHILKAGLFGGLGLRHQLIGAELFMRQDDAHAFAGAGAGALDVACWELGVPQPPDNPPAPSTPIPAVIRPNVRREMPVTE